MRVLMTADAVGGIWTYALDLSTALAEHDISVVLATMGPRPSAAQRAAVQRLSHVQLFESDYRLEWMADCWRDVSAAGEWLLDLADRAGVDLIHLNGYSHAALPWRRPVVCVAHSCVMSWWHAVHREQAPAEWNTYRHNVTSGLNRADLVIAPTQAFLETLQSCYGFKQPATVIRNGRPQNIVYSRATMAGNGHPQRAEQAPATFGGNCQDLATLPRAPEVGCGGLPGGREPMSISGGRLPDESEPVPIGCGRLPGGREAMLLGCGRVWDAAKNLRVFDVAAQGLAWPAYVVGDPAGPDGQTFAARSLRTLGALSHDDVESWLQRASIFVHPALYEPFGLAVLEAASAGCALVLADIPTLRELWDEAAEFFNPCDSAELRATLNVLIGDATKRATLAAAAQRRAAEYGVDAMAVAYAKAYRSLAANVPRTAHAGSRAVA